MSGGGSEPFPGDSAATRRRLASNLVERTFDSAPARVSAPTDGLRPAHEMNFMKSASERLLPWVLIFGFLWAVFLVVARMRKKHAAQ
jgi:hypothetical protein